MKIRVTKTSAFLYISALLSFIILFVNSQNLASGYELIMFFPIAFLLSHTFLMINSESNCATHSLTYAVIIALQWLRFVVMPIFICLAGENCGVSYLNPSGSSLQSATLLMLYELFLTTVFIKVLIMPKFSKGMEPQPLHLKGNPLLYIVFILFSWFLLLTMGEDTPISFIMIKTSGARIGDSLSSVSTLIQYLLILSFMLIFLIILNWCKKKYNKSGKMLYVNISLLAALINICLIIGERRTVQVYAAVCSLMLLIQSFPKHKKRILLIVGSGALGVLALMSVYKFFAAFLYESYQEAIQNSSLNVEEVSKVLQNYFMGPEQVAINIEYAPIGSRDILQCIYDLFRSIFPLSLLLKPFGTVTSVSFNEFIYYGKQSTGYILSSVGYGYIYFRAFLAPIIAIVNIFMAYCAEKKMKKARSYETKYIWGYVCIRIAFFTFNNTPSMLMPISIILVLGFIVVNISALFKPKEQRKLDYRTNSAIKNGKVYEVFK